MSTRVLAIIPARGGSKRIPGKNLREIQGVSLVGWAILRALQSKLVTVVCVTTDHSVIIDEAQHWFSGYSGDKECHVMHRSAELSKDSSPLDTTLIDALRYTNDLFCPDTIDQVVTLQPTSPLRPEGLIDNCITKLNENPKWKSILTVHNAGHFFWEVDHSHPTVKDRYLQVNATHRPNSQDLTGPDKFWAENGCVYVTDAQAMLVTGSRIPFHSGVYPINVPHAMDIDTEEDFQVAEALANTLNYKGGD